MTKISHKERRLAWERHVKAWRESGKTIADYCQEHGLKIGTFKEHERQARQAENPKKRDWLVTDTNAFWEHHIWKWQKSAESMFHYCRLHDLNFVTFQEEKEKLEIRLGRGIYQEGPSLRQILRES